MCIFDIHNVCEKKSYLCIFVLTSVAKSSVTKSGTGRQKQIRTSASKSGHKNTEYPMTTETVYDKSYLRLKNFIVLTCRNTMQSANKKSLFKVEFFHLHYNYVLASFIILNKYSIIMQ